MQFALVQLLHSRGQIPGSCLLKSNRFPLSGCWLAGPDGYFAGATNLSRAEYKMVLRLRLLRFPASLDIGDAEGGIVCRCNRRINIIALLSLSQQPRPVYPPSQPYPGCHHGSDR